MRPDLVGIIESTYDVEQNTSSWIEGVLSRFEPLVGDGVGLFGYTYSVSAEGAVVPGSFGMVGCTQEMSQDLPHAHAFVPIGSDIVVNGYLAADAGVTSEFAGWARSQTAQYAERHGVHDSWFINGRNPARRGCALVVNRRSPGGLSPGTRRLLTRIAAHVAAAARLRARLSDVAADASVEAVLSPDGRVHYAAAMVQTRAALDELRAGAVSIDRARGKLRKSDPERALDSWKGLVAARWTLLDHFESGGRRYVLARENQPEPATPAALSARERQVLANIALGRSNKEVAYALGLAHSTVRVLIARAARKLRASTRAQLVQRFEALSRDGT